MVQINSIAMTLAAMTVAQAKSLLMIAYSDSTCQQFSGVSVINDPTTVAMMESMGSSQLNQCIQSGDKKSWAKMTITNTEYTEANIQELNPQIRFTYAAFSKNDQCSGIPDMLMGVPLNQANSIVGGASIISCDAKQVVMSINGTQQSQPVGCTKSMVNNTAISVSVKCLGEYKPNSGGGGDKNANSGHNRVSASLLSFPILAATVMGFLLI